MQAAASHEVPLIVKDVKVRQEYLIYVLFRFINSSNRENLTYPMCILSRGLGHQIVGWQKTEGMGAPFQGSAPKWHREVVFDPSSNLFEAG